ncbi:hypothetical protein [Marivirga sp.]|uniref:hypothetical protein n=1 Tax=Marivirga sp. TaxID=2018662 RepID=UPI0025D36BA4|nr:hypothetical protein [Marivirga sp.]
MRILLFIFGVSLSIIFSSCSSETENKIVSDSDIEYKFEIVDSLTVDYLGIPFLCDFSPNQEHILLFNSSNREFIITDAKGEIISQFTKEGDIPDNPGSLADRPIFYDNKTIIAHGQKGIWAYNFEGENVWKIEREDPIGYWISINNGRSMYLMEPKHFFTVINYDQLVIDPSNDSLYENHHAFKIINRKAKSIKPVISLESFSRYLDGKGYKPSDMLASNHVKANQMVISYPKEDVIYLYDWKNEFFQLKDTFSLDIEPFYLDEGKERESLEGKKGFFMGGKVGEAEVRGAWLLDGDKVLVKYNSGVKESERQEPKMKKTGENSISLAMPDNVPKDLFQIYKEGEKYGKPFNSSIEIASLLYVDGDFLWFIKDQVALDVEDDYAVFYKTKLVQKE